MESFNERWGRRKRLAEIQASQDRKWNRMLSKIRCRNYLLNSVSAGTPEIHYLRDRQERFVNWLEGRGIDIVGVVRDPSYHDVVRREFLAANRG